MKFDKNILPPPKSILKSDREPLVIGISGKAFYTLSIVADTENKQIASAVKMVRQKLCGLINGTDDGPIIITLQIAEPPADMKNAEQGYTIEADPNGINLTGYGSAGLFYAAVSFCRYLKVDGNRITFPCMKLTDYPDLKTRGHFMESRYGSNLMNLDDWKAVVDNMALIKMNQLVISVYGCWCVQYDGCVSEYLYIPLREYPKLRTPVVTRYFSPSEGWKDYQSLPPMFEEDFFGKLAAYGAEKAVSILPLFNSYGHNTLIPAQYPEVSALEEDGQPSKTGFCTSNPKTYELLFAIYDSIIDRYLIPNGIDSFHIGLDEVWDGIALNAEDIYRTRSTRCRCGECKRKSLNALYIEHAVKLIEHLKNRGMKNIYMYNDMLKFAENPGDSDSPARKIAALLREKKLDKVTILDCWTYSESYEGLSFKSTLPELGLRRTVKPWNGYYHWTLITHPLNNIYMMAKMAYDEDAEGMQSYSAWDDSYRRNHTAQASYAWNFIGSGSIDEFKRSFAVDMAGGDYDTAQRAFEALEACVSYHDGKYAFMMHQLSYYFYSYVRKDKPYPRHFPGEMVTNLLNTRAAAEKMMAEIETSALEAVSLFELLGTNTSADYFLAGRYAYEAGNYLCLVRDYMALLHMHDLSSSLPDTDAINEIRNLAKERCEARLALMALFEKTKEHYLMASHMRNHTIFMQYFADLQGYLTYTAPGSIKLDFTDNTHFASDAFMSLR